jgi:hypothetical protein
MTVESGSFGVVVHIIIVAEELHVIYLPPSRLQHTSLCLLFTHPPGRGLRRPIGARWAVVYLPDY